jgi:uncharacterized protein YjlB
MNKVLHFFEGDGITPNSKYPVVVLPGVYSGDDLTAVFLKCFSKNGWTNNWVDTIQPKDHYHSTTHEVLGIAKGSVSLQIGGSHGKQFHLKAGDVLLLPAGVGHYSIRGSNDYRVVGGYPDGKDWDMIYNTAADYDAARQRIERLTLPALHPITGEQFVEFD